MLPPLCYAGRMARVIRRDLIITIHEQWTFVWFPEQTNVSPVAEEAAGLPSPAKSVQQLYHLLQLPAAPVSPTDNPIQGFHYPSKESSDENTVS